MSVTVTCVDGIVVMRVAGELDMASVHPLATAVSRELSARPKGLVIDLLDVTFCGSSGLRVLVEARALAETTGTGLRLVAMNAAVLRPLELSGLAELFRVHESVAEAMAVVDA